MHPKSVTRRSMRHYSRDIKHAIDNILYNLLSKVVTRRSTRRCLNELKHAIDKLSYDLISELKAGRQLRNLCQGRFDILLNVGCSDRCPKGWINIDYYPRVSEAYYFNLLNPLPIKDESVIHINAEHFLEHLGYDDSIMFLTECYRVLKIGGTMRIIVPDGEKYMCSYARNDNAFFMPLQSLGSRPEAFPTKGAICNRMFRMYGDHQFAWDFETLEYVCHKIGFQSIKKSHHNDKSSPYCIDGQEWWRPFESLYTDLMK